MELDKRLERDISQLEKNLDKYDKLLAEVDNLNGFYKSELDQFLFEANKFKKESNTAFTEFKTHYEKAMQLIEELILKKAEFDHYITKADKMLQNKISIIQQQNETKLHEIDSKVESKISQLEEANKLEFLRIVNSISEHGKEIVSSRKELNNFITEEVEKLIEKNNMLHIKLNELEQKLQEQTSKFETRIRQDRSWAEKEIKEWRNKNDSDHGAISKALNTSLQEKFELLEEKCHSITTKLHFFMAATGVLFVGALFLLIGR